MFASVPESLHKPWIFVSDLHKLNVPDDADRIIGETRHLYRRVIIQ